MSRAQRASGIWRAKVLLAVALFAFAPRAAEARRHPHRARPSKDLAPEKDPALKGDAAAFAGAEIVLRAPLDLAQLDGTEVRIDLEVSKYALAPGGAHAHLIVDNEPALEVDATGTFVLRGLRPGPHLLRAVLCRPWHEVVKARGAFSMVRFWLGPRLGGKAGKAAEYVAWPDPKKPLLTYLLPLGLPGRDAQPLALLAAPLARLDGAEQTSDGGTSDANAIDANATAQTGPPRLDFYLSNGKLDRRGDKLRIVLDRRELPLVTKWEPVLLHRAGPGAHRLSIDLLDRRGRKVKNALNRTDRSFER